MFSSNQPKVKTLNSNLNIFEKFLPEIEKYYLSLGLDKPTSEDLSQDVFLKMVENYSELQESKKNIRSLMYEVARNIRNDHFRKLYRIPKLQSIESVENTLEDQSRVDITVIKNTEAEEVQNKIQQLAPLKQKILELKYKHEFSYEEIAEIMNIELGTVKSQIFRAKEELKNLLIQ
jgi:RNA polymerase sigma factor (sigma-70 family)